MITAMRVAPEVGVCFCLFGLLVFCFCLFLCLKINFVKIDPFLFVPQISFTMDAALQLKVDTFLAQSEKKAYHEGGSW